MSGSSRVRRPNSPVAVAEHERGDPLRAALLVIAVGALCRVLQTTNGVLPDPPGAALAWLALGVGATLAAAFGVMPRASAATGRALLAGTVVVVIVANYAQLAGALPGVYLKIQRSGDLLNFLGGAAAAAALAGVVVVTTSQIVRRVAWIALIVVHLLLGVWVIEHSPAPDIDVFTFQTGAADALVAGRDPYAITYPDIYHGTSSYYGAGVSVNGVVQSGYPYMPLSLVAATAARRVTGDVRYAGLAAVVLAAVLMGTWRPGLSGVVAATLWLSVPRTFTVVESAFTEPVVVLALAATLWCSRRAPRAVPWVLGLLLVSKQYMLAAAVPAILLVDASLSGNRLAWIVAVRRLAWRAAIAAAIVTMPFVLWNVGAFWHSAVLLHLRQPYRPDALGLLPWISQIEPGWIGPSWIQFVALAVTMGIGAWRGARTAGGFFLTVTAGYLVFVLCSTQAFLNYYVLVIGAACCAIAALDVLA